MINEIVDKLLLNTSQLEKEVEEINCSNETYLVIEKIKRCEKLIEEEIEKFKNISVIDESLNAIEKETIDFIIFLNRTEEALDDFQLKLLDKLLLKYQFCDISDKIKKLERTKRLIESLKSKELFTDFEYLKDKLKELNYSDKEILIILKGLIITNFKGYDKSSINNMEEESNEGFTKSEIDYVKKVLKKFRISSNDIDDVLFKYLPKEKDMFNDSEYVLKFIEKCGVKVKKIFESSPLDILFTMAFGKKEHALNIEKICSEKQIDIKRLIKRGCIVLASDRELIVDGVPNTFGLYENFLKNVDMLDRYGFKHNKCKSIELYLVSNTTCETINNLIENEYHLTLKTPQDLEMIYSCFSLHCIDRVLELEDGQKRLQEDYSKFLSMPDIRLYYILKEMDRYKSEPDYTFLSSNQIFDAITNEVAKDSLNLSNLEIPKIEYTDNEKKWLSLFHEFEYESYEPIKIVPMEIGIDYEINNNEYIKYLDNTYKKGKVIYVINDTRVSRIKVLRILNLLKQNQIEITEEAVKFAMKFGMVLKSSDLENIDNSLNEYKSERTKKLC